MKTFFELGALILAVLTLTSFSSAQTTVAPIPLPSPPYEEIVQFNNLRITQIALGNVFVAITNPEIPNPCLRYESESTARGVVFPCPSPLGVSETPGIIREASYNVHITSRTILLLRDRSKATFSEFQVGDRINVYGFYDTETNGVDALIVRNLSKPKERRFVQINNVEVVSEPSSDTPPATMVVVQRNIYPCLDYGSAGSGPGRSFPCPLGLKTFGEANLPQLKAQPLDESLYPPSIARKYVVEITPQTILLTRTRGPLNLSDITMGDKLNIYGLLRDDNATVEALIIRDLSKPLQAETAVGTITEIASDGSFTIQLGDGSMLKVKPGLQVGQRVEVRGFIDRVNKVISDLFHIKILKPEVLPAR